MKKTKGTSYNPEALTQQLPQLLSGRAHYWPFKRQPESRLSIYAVACLQTALEFSDRAQALYFDVVEAWRLPGCQAMLNEALEKKQEAKDWAKRFIEALEDETGNIPKPTHVYRAHTKYKDNADFRYLISCAAKLISEGFNRQIDLEEERPKIIPGKSPYLVFAVGFRSLIDCAEIDYAYLRRHKLIRRPDGSVYDFETLMTMNPTRRKEREQKHQFIRVLKAEGYQLCSDEVIVNGAEKWYKARVFYNTVREAANYYRIDATDLSKRIRPYDDATGYPYQK